MLCFPWQAGPQSHSCQKVSSHSNLSLWTMFCSCAKPFTVLDLPFQGHRHILLLYQFQSMLFVIIHSKAHKSSACPKPRICCFDPPCSAHDPEPPARRSPLRSQPGEPISDTVPPPAAPGTPFGGLETQQAVSG